MYGLSKAKKPPPWAAPRRYATKTSSSRRYYFRIRPVHLVLLHISTQYREAGVFLWRGFDLDMVAHQLFSNAKDLGKGRQMPMHFGVAKFNMQTVSSPLATQLPQATGVAYALKLEKSPAICVCYFGEGAASEGDFHTALNFAATTESPVLFFVRNNGYAISTPVREQFRGDGIVSRAAGYGMASMRVDGNDLLAVHHATAAAREWVHANQKPLLLEVLSYRGGHHSTSDDSSRYRAQEEITFWQENNNPITRVNLYLTKRGLWNAERQAELVAATKKTVLQGLANAENQKKPPTSELFTDVYHELPPHLKLQQVLGSLVSHPSLFSSLPLFLFAVCVICCLLVDRGTHPLLSLWPGITQGAPRALWGQI
jgi:2-oxoisovalerate dehydrogenase E1 component alpha subunit